MRVRRRRDRDRVELAVIKRVVEARADGTAGLARGDLRAPVLARVTQPEQLEVRALHDVAHDVRAPVAVSDDDDADRNVAVSVSVHGFTPSPASPPEAGSPSL